MKRYSEEFKIKERSIKDLIFEGKLKLFEDLIKIYKENPTLIITTLLETIKALKRDGTKVNNLTDKHFIDLFTSLKNNEISKEAIEDILIKLSNSPNISLKEAKEQLKIIKLSDDDLIKSIQKIINKEVELIRKSEMRAFGPLMGEVMKEVRGKIDGKIVAEKLKEAIINKLEELKK